MRGARWCALTGCAGLVTSVLVAVAGPASASATPARVQLRGSRAPAAARSHPDGSVSATSKVSFDLVLSLKNAAAAQAFVKEVSEPGSADYHHFLSDAQWTARFGPSASEVSAARAWLRSSGFSVGAVPGDRLFVPAAGTALSVEKAFSVKLGYYLVNGSRVRLASGSLSIPSSLSGSVTEAARQLMEFTAGLES